jgi:hypothetical protein
MRKLDNQTVLKTFKPHGEKAPQWGPQSIPAMQVAVYVMCGGSLLGRMAAEQPADFYIDSRCGRLPYGRREIMQAVQVLVLAAGANGLDPHNMPEMPRFHNMGVL